MLANVNGLYLASLLSVVAEELHLLLQMVISACSCNPLDVPPGHVTEHFDHLFQYLDIQIYHNGKEILI